ncbi:MAG TPA: VWA domain-containing protein [Vicinamibacterales bacterium]|nr:VWA domain-containing protein [Vicinamibacterales bacterium]
MTTRPAWIVAAALALGQAGSVPAQKPAPDRADGTVRPTNPEPAARSVRIDVVVTDRRGAPVLDLKPEDFQLVENGVAQRIDAVELRVTAADGSGATPFPIENDADELRAARDPDTRIVGLILDEFHVGAGAASERVRQAVRQFIDERVHPGDLLAIMKPLDPVTAIRFTRDRSLARQAVESFAGRKGDYTPRTEFEKKYMGRAPAAVEFARVQIVMAALRAMVMKLGELETGRSAVVLVSEGFDLPDTRSRERRVPEVQGLIRAASRFNVAVYTFDPSGGEALDASGADAGTEATLQSIAARTGGEAVAGTADLLSGLARVSRDLDAYYFVSYTSTHAADGRFYDIQVRTTRRDARVRTRSGYWAPLRSELLSARSEERRSAPVRALRRSPLIQTWLGLTVNPDGTERVTFTWEPANGASRAAPVPHSMFVTVTRDGSVLYEGEISSARAQARGLLERAARFDTPPGRIQVDLTIYGADGSQIDTAAHDIDVPDAGRADPLILPPQVFRAGSAREFRELLAADAPAPVPSRTFRRTERLLLRVPAYSASGASIRLTARLTNRRGQVLRGLAPAIIGSSGITQFDLPLASLAPGDYTIDLTASSERGSARELILFRVTG